MIPAFRGHLGNLGPDFSSIYFAFKHSCPFTPAQILTRLQAVKSNNTTQVVFMSTAAVEKYLASLKGSECSYPFGPEVMVFKVMGKMFALLAEHENVPRVTLKCVPEDGAMLVSQFESVIPGYHMSKKHWITISLTGELPLEMLYGLVNDSYKLVVNKLTKIDKLHLETL
jgi:predicted DNA-binding protein (MmcQ/YjbR family)